MLRQLAVALSLVAIPAALQAQEVTTFTLDNGMDVVVIEDHRAPAVTHMVWYRTGSADEPPGASGVAHFLEHLLFKATDTLDAGEFSATVAANGGNDNAFTSYDYTAYFQRLAADRLPLMMQMESDRMNNLRLTEDDIVTERQVILEERSSRTDTNPNAIAREQLRAALYMNHRYGTPIIGWRHEMETLDMADVLSFYDLYYSPNNAILVVAGDVDPQEVRRLAEEHYGPIPTEPHLPSRYRPAEPPQLAERRMIYEDERVSQPYLTRAYLAPERDPGAQETAAALTYLAEILGGSSFTSLLGRALTFDSQTALFTGASYDGMNLDTGSFSLTVLPAEGVTLEEAEAAMDQVLTDFLANGVDPAQFERIRTQLRASEIFARDDVAGLANRYGAALASGLSVEDVQAWPDILQSVTPEDVRAAAEAVLDRRQSVTMYVVPSREML
jgi:zinc protease